MEEFDGSELTIGMDLGHFKKNLHLNFLKNKFVVPEIYKICINIYFAGNQDHPSRQSFSVTPHKRGSGNY